MPTAIAQPHPGPCVIEYKIYQRHELNQQHHLGKEGYRFIYREINGRAFALGVNCDWCSLPKQSLFTTHIEFFALSAGWEAFTGTGYKSHFASMAESGLFEDDDAVIEYYDTVFTVADFDPYISYQPSLF